MGNLNWLDYFFPKIPTNQSSTPTVFGKFSWLPVKAGKKSEIKPKNQRQLVNYKRITRRKSFALAFSPTFVNCNKNNQHASPGLRCILYFALGFFLAGNFQTFGVEKELELDLRPAWATRSANRELRTANCDCNCISLPLT